MRRDVHAWIKRALTDWAASADQHTAIQWALEREAFPLHPHAQLRAGALAAIAYHATGGKEKPLAIAAAAISELFMSAGFMLDHVMDEEVGTDQSIGRTTALGLSTLLIAETALSSTAVALSAQKRSMMMFEVQRLILASCDGQYQEMAVRGDHVAIASLSSDYALELTRRKAGTLGEMCAVIGAGLSGQLDAGITGDLRECAARLLTYRQILDDLADAVAGADKASDIEIGNPTLPCVFYLKKTLADLGADTTGAHGKGGSTIRVLRERINPSEDDLQRTGVALFAQIVAEAERNRAIALAHTIHEQCGGADDLLKLVGVKLSEDNGRHSGATPA